MTIQDTENSRLVGTTVENPLQICLISGNGPDGIGGLSSYLRCLANNLSLQHNVSIVARFTQTATSTAMYAGAEQPRVINHGQYQTHIIAPRTVWKPVLQRFVSLVARPALQPLAIWLYRRAYQPPLAAAIPAAANVIHYIGNGWELLGFTALAEARKRGAAFTILPAVHPGAWGDSSLDVALYNQADSVFVLSEFERDYLIRLGVAPSQLQVTGLAPASDATGNAARFRQTHGLGDRPLILFVGRKDRGKGYHALREAMPRILEAVPDACLVAIGPDREPPYPDVPETALLDLGRAEEDEKADALAACNVFCLPSEQESFGIVYVEAWSYGKPVVGGDAPAVREMIHEGIDGYCVSQAPAEIASVLVRLLFDPAHARALGEAGYQRQQNNYTWEAVTQTHNSIFHKIND